jgi:hypothetical protein
MFATRPAQSNQLSDVRPRRNHTPKTPLSDHGSKAGLPMYLQRSSEPGEHDQNGRNLSGIGAALQDSLPSGSALPDQTRDRFEVAFESDLSAVRIHHDPRHNSLARSLNARAFTLGPDIFFGPGFYRPGTLEGDRLLAHELTHVIQQRTGRVQGAQIEPGLSMTEAGDGHELEAERFAAVMTGQSHLRQQEPGGLPAASTALPDSAAAVIQRDNDEDEEEGFDVSLLPPEFSYRSGPFGVSADTSAARLSLFSGEGEASLGYEYGGDIFYGLDLGDFRTRFGVNPQTGVGSMSLGGSHGGFRYGLSGSTAGRFGLSLGYGAPLLPMPDVLGQQAGAAWQGALEVGGAVPEFVSDPMAAYEAYREQIGAMGAFGSSLGRIYGQQGEGGLPFGAGLTVSSSPEERLRVMLGLQASF